MKKLFIVLFLIGVLFSAAAQVSVNYYYDGNTLGISSSPDKKSWVEFRVNTTSYNHAPWSYADRGITQAYFCFKLAEENKAALYSGIGGGIPLLSNEIGWASINVPLGIQIQPSDRFPGLYITGEYNGMAVISDGVDIINTLSFGFKFRIQKN